MYYPLFSADLLDLLGADGDIGLGLLRWRSIWRPDLSAVLSCVK